jgi:hypothetical protein
MTPSVTPSPAFVDLTGLPESVIEQIHKIVSDARSQHPPPAATTRPPLLGRFASLGLSFTKDELDEAQREIWANFPRDFPETPRQ